MHDDLAKTESELTNFFTGLDAGLQSLREVRSVYDEEVAFEFNATSLFSPNENKTSEILAFFLNPNEKHGQRAAFLKLWIKQFNITIPTQLLEDLKAIKVDTQDATREKRFVDITIVFGNNDYVMGIENKIWAPDGKDQLKDYVKELRHRTKDDDKKWTLFYLTPGGKEPAQHSMPKEHQEELIHNENRNLQLVSYSEDIIVLLGQFETACKAESVRAFLKDFNQYIRRIHIGEAFMGENTFVVKFIKNHPEILKHAKSIENAIESLKAEIFDSFWKTVAENLKCQGITINPSDIRYVKRGSSGEALVELPESSPFNAKGDLRKIAICYEARLRAPYISICMGRKRQDLLQESRDKVGILENKLKEMKFDVAGHVGYEWYAAVFLPQIDVNKTDDLPKILESDDIENERAKEAAAEIQRYVHVVQSIWR